MRVEPSRIRKLWITQLAKAIYRLYAGCTRFRDEGCTSDAVKYAALYGHLEVIQWLQSAQTPGLYHRGHGSCGQIGTLEWLHLNRSEGFTIKAINLAASNRHAKTVEWLQDNRTAAWSPHAIIGARDLGILKYLYQHYPPNVESVKSATNISAINGHLKAVQFLTSHHQVCLEPEQISWIKNNGSFAAAEWSLKQAVSTQ